MKNRMLMIVLTLLTAAVSWADVETSTNSEGVILNGHDAVAYFTEGKPVEGESRFATEHAGAVYHFSTTENRDAFLANPEHFAPVYGGYCAYGTSVGKKFAVDGKAFKIVDDRLYVNKNLKVFETWVKDVPGNIVKANREWPRIRNTPAEDL
jgi:YHS domain-containing protein